MPNIPQNKAGFFNKRARQQSMEGWIEGNLNFSSPPLSFPSKKGCSNDIRKDEVPFISLRSCVRQIWKETFIQLHLWI